MGKKECPYCKSMNYKLLLAKNKSTTLADSPNSLYDPETDLYFED